MDPQPRSAFRRRPHDEGLGYYRGAVGRQEEPWYPRRTNARTFERDVVASEPRTIRHGHFGAFPTNRSAPQRREDLYRGKQEGDANRDQKGDPVQTRGDLDLLRKAAVRNLAYHGIKLGVTKEEYGGGVQPFSGKTEGAGRKEGRRGADGRQPPPNSPDRIVKFGPPQSRKQGKIRTFEDLTTIETRARTKEAARGGSEIRIVYEERKLAPLQREFWQGVQGMSTPSPSRSSGITSSTPSRADSDDQPTSTVATTVRSVDSILPEVIEVLRQLKIELKTALDVETRLLIHEVEVDAEGILDLREGRKGEKDQDGDVTMDKEEATSKEPGLTYFQPSSPEPGQIMDEDYVPQSPEPECGTLLRLMKAEEEIESLKWKMVNQEDHDGRLVSLENRMLVLEDQKVEDKWTMVTIPSRREANRPLTRSQTRRVDLTETGKEVVQLQSKLTALEKAVEKSAKGGENNRKKVNGLDMRVAGAEGEVMASRSKVAGLEKKEEEGSLRLTLAIRELTQSRNFVTEGLNIRMARVEARLLELEHRSVTSAEQIHWNDQKIRGVWHALNAPNPEETCLRTAALRLIWANASGAFTRRLNSIPYANVPSQAARITTGQPTATGSLPGYGERKPPSS